MSASTPATKATRSPPIQVFLTTIASQPALRRRQEFLLRTLQVKKIEFSSYDLASDEAAKRLWKRKAPLDKQQLPGILIGNTFPGTIADFEEAVEYGELDTFLRLNETWYDEEDGPPMLPVQPIGVPGASSTADMTPAHLKSKIYDTPPLKGKDTIPVNKKQGEFDVSIELEGYGLQGVMATDDELRALVEELGLGGDEAGDLIKGLGGKATSGPVASEATSTNVASEATSANVASEATNEAKVVSEVPTEVAVVPEVKIDANVTEVPTEVTAVQEK